MNYANLVSDLVAPAAPANRVTIDGESYKVIVHSWGYDQTNIYFWAVTYETKAFVTLRRLRSKTVEATGFMSARVAPAPSWHPSNEVQRKKKCHGPEGRLSFGGVNGHGWSTEWTGAASTETSYH